MKRSIRTRVICCILGLLLLSALLAFPTEPALAAIQNQQPPRYVNVVYDDSGSMISPDDGSTFVDTWCQAKYAMEVFAALLDSNDLLNIYMMSKSGVALSLAGEQDVSSRVRQVHEMVTENAGETPYAPVAAAYADLSRQSDEYQKWLVVLTDGHFNSGLPAAGLDASLRDYADNGVNIVFLAIGAAADSISPDASRGIFFERAASSSDILVCIENICNRIFQRNKLPNFDARVGSLSFDIPLAELIVFAQGQAVTVNGLSGVDGQIAKTSSANVSYSTQAALNYERVYGSSIVVADDLNGVLTVFAGAQNPLPAGAYQLAVDGASTVDVYYKPNATVSMKLYHEGEEVTELHELTEGDYTIEFGLADPASGEYLQSALLGAIDYVASADNNGVLTSLNSGDTFTVSEGSMTVAIQATFLEYNTVSLSADYLVQRPLQPLELTVSGPQDGYQLTSLEQDPNSILVTVRQDGEYLSPEQWQALELQASSRKNVDWVVMLGPDISTYEIHPVYANGEMGRTGSGEVKLLLQADLSWDDWHSEGQSELLLNIEDDRPWLVRYRWLVALAALALLLFICYGPLKKRLPKMLPEVRPLSQKTPDGQVTLLNRVHPQKKKIRKKRVFLPLAPEEALINISHTAYNGHKPTLRIRACGKRRFTIVNINSFLGDNANSQTMAYLNGEKLLKGEFDPQTQISRNSELRYSYIDGNDNIVTLSFLFHN